MSDSQAKMVQWKPEPRVERTEEELEALLDQGFERIDRVMRPLR